MTLNDQKRIIDLWVQFWGGNEMAFSQLYCLCFDDLLVMVVEWVGEIMKW